MSNNITSDKFSNFTKRLISSLIIGLPMLYVVYVGSLLYFLALIIVIFIIGYEWNDLCGKWSFGIDSMTFITVLSLSTLTAYMNRLILSLGIILVGSYIVYLVAKIRRKAESTPIIPEYLNRPLWFFIGSLYFSLGFASMALIKNYHNITLIWVLMAVSANDIFAYFFGSIIGGKKILPKISPGKSWGGFIGGALGAMIISYLFALYIGKNNELILIIVGFFMSVCAHIGDFLESGFKRYINTKDSSSLIPGHGGMLDRIDGLLFASIYIAILCIILGKTPLLI